MLRYSGTKAPSTPSISETNSPYSRTRYPSPSSPSPSIILAHGADGSCATLALTIYVYTTTVSHGLVKVSYYIQPTTIVYDVII